jgi:hypothetical protein
MNTTQPTKKPRPTLWRRIYDAFVWFGETAGRGGQQPQREPKPGEFWAVEKHPQNPWANILEGARVLDVKDGWVRFERVYDRGTYSSTAIRCERMSYFQNVFQPPAE